MLLRLPDPSSTERFLAFLRSLGQEVAPAGADAVRLEREIPRAELEIYLRVWSVLHPEAPVSVE